MKHCYTDTEHLKYYIQFKGFFKVKRNYTTYEYKIAGVQTLNLQRNLFNRLSDSPFRRAVKSYSFVGKDPI